MHSDRILRLSWCNPYRASDRPFLKMQFNDSVVRQAMPLCQSRANQHRIIPREFRGGLWAFLQPAVIGELSIPEVGVGPKVDFEVRHWWRDRRTATAKITEHQILISRDLTDQGRAFRRAGVGKNGSRLLCPSQQPLLK